MAALCLPDDSNHAKSFLVLLEIFTKTTEPCQDLPMLFHTSNLVSQARYMFIRLTGFRRRSCRLLHGSAMDRWLYLP